MKDQVETNKESVEDAIERVKKKREKRERIFIKNTETPEDMKGILAGDPDELSNDVNQKNKESNGQPHNND